MKLFWKIFILVFISFALIVTAIAYIMADHHISDAKRNIIEENRISGSFILKELEIGYKESKWPFESLKKLEERNDFLFWWVV